MFQAILKDLRTARGLTQQQLADHLGMAKSTISMYENGKREPDLQTLHAIAAFFDVDMNYLTDRQPAARLVGRIPNLIPLPEMRKIPLLGDIACGTPLLAEQNYEDYIDIPAHIHADFALRCKGDSMVEAHLYDGDIVYIIAQPDVENGQIAAVLIDEEATLKRVYKSGERVILQPENKSYPPIVLAGRELEQVRILGLAIAYTSRIR